VSPAIDRLRDAAGSLRSRLPHGRRPRLALVTPWPPERSGIAGYSARLARELAHEVDVDVVVAGPLERYEAPREPGLRLRSASAPATGEWLRRQRHVLYCMGNSGFHGHVYSLLCERPGAVLLHDVQLTGFFGAFAGSQRPEDPNGWLLEQVERHYGGELSREQLRSAMLSSQEREARGIYMTAEIRRFAQRLFVHSRFAADVVARDRGRDVPVTVMAFGVPTPDGHGARGAATQTPLVVHMGALSETKSTAVLIEAFGAVLRRHPGARLVLAGSDDESGPAHWQALVREHAPAGSVEIAGFVDGERYETLLAGADVAVQLRAISNGEASAAVADCLAAGIPTIVTDLAWTGELPSSAVRHVPPGAGAALLAEQIDALIADPRARLALSEGALAFAAEHSFRAVADAYRRELDLS
jgi:glycosyltransferase involved in cell wall biosynthesis